MYRITPFLLICLSGCAAFPELDARMTEADLSAPYPALVPVGPLLAAADQQGAQAPQAALEGRIAALEARAAALRSRDLNAPAAN